MADGIEVGSSRKEDALGQLIRSLVMLQKDGFRKMTSWSEKKSTGKRLSQRRASRTFCNILNRKFWGLELGRQQ